MLSVDIMRKEGTKPLMNNDGTYLSCMAFLGVCYGLYFVLFYLRDYFHCKILRALFAAANM